MPMMNDIVRKFKSDLEAGFTSGVNSGINAPAVTTTSTAAAATVDDDTEAKVELDQEIDEMREELWKILNAVEV